MGNSLRLRVTVTPRAARAGVVGLVERAGGEVALKLTVTAPPEDGRANDAVVRLLADIFRLPARAFVLLRGAASRDKLFQISGPPDTLLPLIEEGLRPWLRPS